MAATTTIRFVHDESRLAGSRGRGLMVLTKGRLVPTAVFCPIDRLYIFGREPAAQKGAKNPIQVDSDYVGRVQGAFRWTDNYWVYKESPHRKTNRIYINEVMAGENDWAPILVGMVLRVGLWHAIVVGDLNPTSELVVAASSTQNFHALLVLGHGSVNAAEQATGIHHTTLKKSIRSTTYGDELLASIKAGAQGEPNVWRDICDHNRRNPPAKHKKTRISFGFATGLNTTTPTQIGY